MKNNVYTRLQRDPWVIAQQKYWRGQLDQYQDIYRMPDRLLNLDSKFPSYNQFLTSVKSLDGIILGSSLQPQDPSVNIDGLRKVYQEMLSVRSKIRFENNAQIFDQFVVDAFMTLSVETRSYLLASDSGISLQDRSWLFSNMDNVSKKIILGTDIDNMNLKLKGISQKIIVNKITLGTLDMEGPDHQYCAGIGFDDTMLNTLKNSNSANQAEKDKVAFTLGLVSSQHLPVWSKPGVNQDALSNEVSEMSDEYTDLVQSKSKITVLEQNDKNRIFKYPDKIQFLLAASERFDQHHVSGRSAASSVFSASIILSAIAMTYAHVVHGLDVGLVSLGPIYGALILSRLIRLSISQYEVTRYRNQLKSTLRKVLINKIQLGQNLSEIDIERAIKSEVFTQEEVDKLQSTIASFDSNSDSPQEIQDVNIKQKLHCMHTSLFWGGCTKGSRGYNRTILENDMNERQIQTITEKLEEAEQKRLESILDLSVSVIFTVLIVFVATNPTALLIVLSVFSCFSVGKILSSLADHVDNTYIRKSVKFLSLILQFPVLPIIYGLQSINDLFQEPTVSDSNRDRQVLVSSKSIKQQDVDLQEIEDELDDLTINDESKHGQAFGFTEKTLKSLNKRLMASHAITDVSQDIVDVSEFFAFSRDDRQALLDMVSGVIKCPSLNQKDFSHMSSFLDNIQKLPLELQEKAVDLPLLSLGAYDFSTKVDYYGLSSYQDFFSTHQSIDLSLEYKDKDSQYQDAYRSYLDEIGCFSSEKNVTESSVYHPVLPLNTSNIPENPDSKWLQKQEKIESIKVQDILRELKTHNDDNKINENRSPKLPPDEQP